MFIVIPKEATKKLYKKIKIISKLKWNTEIYSHDPKEGTKGEAEKQNMEGTNKT